MEKGDEHLIPYTLIRTKRKTVAIQIKADSSVVVRAPRRLAKREIDRMVQQKADWIFSHQQQMQQRAQQSFCLSDGQLPLLGRLVPIEYTDGGTPIYSQGKCFLPKGEETELRQQAEQLYRMLAREMLENRVSVYAKRVGVSPTGLRITEAKGRWGSCSGKNSLNFSWRLILAPEHCVDYVVVHELCHILHHDHSPAFWQEVERWFPDWQQCREQLAQVSRQPWFPHP